MFCFLFNVVVHDSRSMLWVKTERNGGKKKIQISSNYDSLPTIHILMRNRIWKLLIWWSLYSLMGTTIVNISGQFSLFPVIWCRVLKCCYGKLEININWWRIFWEKRGTIGGCRVFLCLKLFHISYSSMLPIIIRIWALQVWGGSMISLFYGKDVLSSLIGRIIHV